MPICRRPTAVECDVLRDNNLKPRDWLVVSKTNKEYVFANYYDSSRVTISRLSDKKEIHE